MPFQFFDFEGMGLAQPVNCKVLESNGSEDYCVGVGCMQGYRLDMEDAHDVQLGLSRHPNISFFGVFDGHGGGDAAKFCRSQISKRINELDDITEENIYNTLLDLDREFLDENNASRDHGSTAVFALVERVKKGEEAESKSSNEPPSPDAPLAKAHDGVNFRVTVANVGDSRCIYGLIPNRLVIEGEQSHERAVEVIYKAMTEDHKPSIPEEKLRIELAGGFVQNGRVDSTLAVSRAFGDSSYKAVPDKGAMQQKVVAAPDITSAEITSEHYLLLCCDGIYETLSTYDVANFMATDLDRHGCDDPKATVARLMDYALEAGSRDNMTAVLVFLKNGKQFAGGSREFLPGRPGLDRIHSAGRRSKFIDAYISFAKDNGFENEARSYLGPSVVTQE